MTSFPTRRARRRAPLSWFLPVALLAGGCLDDRGLGPEGPAARLALRAQVGALAVTALRLEGAYARSDQSSGALATQSLELPAGAAPGTSVDLPVTIDLGACLADPLAVPGGGACTVTLTLVLLDGARELDRVTIGPLVLRPGETSTPAPVALREAASVSVSASSASPLLPGQTVQLSAVLLDAAGAELEGRTFDWASGTPSVATVDAASGLVTAVAPGTSVVTATAGGRSGQVSVTVRENARIALSQTSVFFDGYTGAELPNSRSVSITNAAEGTLAGLSIGALDYSPGASGWLSATLSSATAPATLVLRPTHTDLAGGSYTAVVPVQSANAENSPQSVVVTFSVTDLSEYDLFVDVGFSSVFLGDTVSVVAILFHPQTEQELDGLPVSWSVSPASAGSFSPSSVTGESAQYVAGGYQGIVSFTATVGPHTVFTGLLQNSSELSLRRSTAQSSAGPARLGLRTPPLDLTRPFTPAPTVAPWEMR